MGAKIGEVGPGRRDYRFSRRVGNGQDLFRARLCGRVGGGQGCLDPQSDVHADQRIPRPPADLSYRSLSDRRTPRVRRAQSARVFVLGWSELDRVVRESSDGGRSKRQLTFVGHGERYETIVQKLKRSKVQTVKKETRMRDKG